MKVVSIFLIISMSILVCSQMVEIKTSNEDVTPPTLTVYGESLCPYTILFIIQNLIKLSEFPAKDKLVSSFEFIPFGNAEETDGSVEGSRKFKCQHGEKECYGNKLQNCAFKYLDNKSAFEYLSCFSQSVKTIGRDKADLNEITQKCSESSKEIIECSSSSEGDELLHDAGVRTGDHEYVPYVIFNGVHDEDIQNKAQDDLLGFLCEYNKSHGNIVPECSSLASIKYLERSVTFAKNLR